jgi:ketosteroid isomerase-like protein
MKHMRARRLVFVAGCLLGAGFAHAQSGDATSPPEPPELFAEKREVAQQEVFAAERAFARSMADRDREAFARFIADEAVFFGGASPLRGKAEVLEGWSRFFEGPDAPFSWSPDQVEVLASGTLALSTGLVRDPQGKVIARFNSVWRLESPGEWRVVFDKGSPPEPRDTE